MIDLMHDKKWAAYMTAHRLDRIFARLVACEFTPEGGGFPVTFALELGWMHKHPRFAIGWWTTKPSGKLRTYFSYTTHCSVRWLNIFGKVTKTKLACELCLEEDTLYRAAQMRLALRQMYGDEVVDNMEEEETEGEPEPAPDLPAKDDDPRPGMGPLSKLQ